MVAVNPIKQIYRRLSQLGFNPKFVRENVLPGWWEDEIALEELGFIEALLIISRHLGINFDALKDPSAQLVYDSVPTRFYKGPEIPGEDTIAPCIAERAARIALLGVPKKQYPSLPSAYTLRQTILASKDAVHFRDLLTFCWNEGIPVLHIKNFPSKAKKLVGVAVSVDGQCAIVLCRQNTNPAWHLFPLAHELGHLARRHLEFDNLLFDTERELTFNNTTEKEANLFALNLLAGSEPLPRKADDYGNPQSLADASFEYGRTQHVDAGFLILNRAKHTKDWREAQTLLNYYIEPDQNALRWVNEEMEARLNWNDIPRDSQEFLRKITGSS